jgi:NB-ARC domain
MERSPLGNSAHHDATLGQARFYGVEYLLGGPFKLPIGPGLKGARVDLFIGLIVQIGAYFIGLHRLARQEGKTVSPIRGPSLVDLTRLPRWLGQLYDLELPEHLNKLFGVLAVASRQKRTPMMAPEPPAGFVKRPVEFGAHKHKLLDAKGDAVAISAALKGAGGYGKTRALAHDEDIRDAYFDGVLWVELGEEPTNLLDIVLDLITRLTGASPEIRTVNAAGSALGESLGERRILLIIDDAWRERDLTPFCRVVLAQRD